MTSIASATELLSQHYRINAQLSRLDGDRDNNFFARDTQGQRYVFKVMHPDCDPGAVAQQCQALAHLKDRELNLPSVVTAPGGESWLEIPLQEHSRILWLLSWCEGELLANYAPHNQTVLESFGATVGRLDALLAQLPPPEEAPDNLWLLSKANRVRPWATDIRGDAAAVGQRVFERFEAAVAPQLEQLPHSLIHNDANDYNVLVDTGSGEVNGLFDFGDMAWQPVVCEVAIALAYLILGKDDPLQVCAHFLRGYQRHQPLSEAELEVLFDLLRTRLAVSIAISSHRQISEPDDPYITISQAPAKGALLALESIPAGFATCVFRDACGWPVVAQAPAVTDFLENLPQAPCAAVELDGWHCLDLSIGSPMLGSDPANAELGPLTDLIEADMVRAGVRTAIGRYAEARGIYNNAAFGGTQYPTRERRTEHLGIDIFAPPTTTVRAPLAATVELVHNNAQPLDYGPVVVLRHETDTGEPFFTLYGHLCGASISTLEAGQSIARGQGFAKIGHDRENGGWTPHLHIQIIVDLLGLGADFPGVARPSESGLWRALCPTPALLFPAMPAQQVDGRAQVESLLERRRLRLSNTLSLSYDQPLHIVRGRGQFLYDSQARAYLDLFNNVAHLGHSHPAVVDAVCRQSALLNTNTRYLHNTILDYADRLVATLPAPLEVCFFVNSASEANELALRLARTATGHRDMLVVEAAYHGHTSSLVEMSPYKYDGPGGEGQPAWVHEAPLADDYRGRFRRDDPLAGHKYAQAALEVMDKAREQGRDFAGFIAESLPSVGGQLIFPDGYLEALYRGVWERGGLCIADEVQVGFGRLGEAFWGFQSQNVVPDVVVLGKPIANGFPLGAVVTTREIAEAFDTGMEFFATFGGNPVACAAGLAVLNTVLEEQLPANAARQGKRLLAGLKDLQAQHPVIGDARGMGLFLGLELVANPATLEPAPEAARYIVNRLRDHHILTGIDGLYHNVVKIRPPMVIEERDIDHLLAVLAQILKEHPLKTLHQSKE